MKIAIASGKGGTGKTTLATNLASVWAETDNVALADLDVEEPNGRLFLAAELIENKTINKQAPQWDSGKCRHSGICKTVCNFNSIIRMGSELIVIPELCHSCYACVELCHGGALQMAPIRIGELSVFKACGGLTFVESRLDIGQEQALPLISQTKKYIDEHFGDGFIKIYDSPPGTTCPVIEVVKNTDLVVLATEPTPFGLNDLKLATELIRKMNIDMAVVINRWGIGDSCVERSCSDNNIDIIARIPHKKEIAIL